MDKLLKIASAGLILWKMYHEKKVYDAQMAEYKKQDEQYQKDNEQYEQDEEEYLTNLNKDYLPIADDVVTGVEFMYQLYIKKWSGNCCKVRLVLQVKNSNNYDLIMRQIKITPVLYNEPAPMYAYYGSKTLKAGKVTTLQEWEWRGTNMGNYRQEYDGFTSDNVTLAVGHDWDAFQDKLHDNDDEITFGSTSATSTDKIAENTWYWINGYTDPDFHLRISARVELDTASGRISENIASYSAIIRRGQILYKSRNVA